MSRRLLTVAVLVALVPTTAHAAKPKTTWADAEIRALGADPASFRPDATVTRGELAELLATATGTAPTLPVTKPETPLTMQTLDARLVASLGLRSTAKRLAQVVKDAGLAPPARFGDEVVVRLLTLRKNHPAARDALERLPADPASRAEAAYSVARIVRFGGWELAATQTAADSFALPPLNEWQRRVLTTAVKLIGYPYVWGGTSDKQQTLFGATVPGGYDCSGFVWRVYKLQAYLSSGTLASTLRGRTTYAMSAEVPKAKRIPFERLQPADVVFFGAKGVRSKPSEVGHMGLYLGGGWMIHSSGQGVALAPLTGWHRTSFAWARRPLAEAGLVSSA